MTESSILRILARHRAGQIDRVEVVNHRLPAAGFLVGKTVEEARRLAPVFLSLGGRAHGVAVAAACAVAQGEPLPGGEPAVHGERALAAEAAQDHLWRLLLDWPPLFGYPPPRHRFGHLYRRLSQWKSAEEAYSLGGDLLDLVADELLSGFFHALREPTTLSEFVIMARRGGTVGRAMADLIELGAYVPPEAVCAPLLPTLSAGDWAQTLGGMPTEAFCSAPSWEGQACETGALTRHMGSPLVAMLVNQGHRIAGRLFARVVDLGECASRLRYPLPADLPPLLDAAPLGPNCGLARVETSRGVLLHAVRLEGGKVAEYAIVTPAEWNFHPQGPLFREATGRPAPQAADSLRQLRALVLALDPGAAFEVEMLDESNNTPGTP